MLLLLMEFAPNCKIQYGSCYGYALISLQSDFDKPKCDVYMSFQSLSPLL